MILLLWLPAFALDASVPADAAPAQQTSSSPSSPALSQETVDKLLAAITELDARVRELEKKLNASEAAPMVKISPATPASTPTATSNATSALSAPAPEPRTMASADDHDHMMTIPGGPSLHLRGFGDFNLGFGQDANPLVFPLGVPVKSSFEIGEIDLYLTSQLSPKISFLSEMVVSADQTNTFSWDIERFQMTYKPSPYFEISGGRFHTSIGYYNTTFHHGTWFQTTTGRPFMYFFEDSGGILPVHTVGITTTGLLPKTGKMNLHWVAEGGNGRAANPTVDPVQSFVADRNHKAFNVAAYAKPDWVAGLQVGASFYLDKLYPMAAVNGIEVGPTGAPGVSQHISSAYAVYNNSNWEFLNEAVLLTNKVPALGLVYHTPLMYTQVSRGFNRYRPFFRYQYVNVPWNDPINIFTGRYQGPSVGVRMDFTTYVALKAQYNHLYQRNMPSLNGLDLQMAFTF